MNSGATVISWFPVLLPPFLPLGAVLPQNCHSEESRWNRDDEAPTPSRVLDKVGKSLAPSVKILRFSHNDRLQETFEAKPLGAGKGLR